MATGQKSYLSVSDNRTRTQRELWAEPVTSQDRCYWVQSPRPEDPAEVIPIDRARSMETPSPHFADSGRCSALRAMTHHGTEQQSAERQ
jgi:hypothetical protein